MVKINLAIPQSQRSVVKTGRFQQFTIPFLYRRLTREPIGQEASVPPVKGGPSSFISCERCGIRFKPISNPGRIYCVSCQAFIDSGCRGETPTDTLKARVEKDGTGIVTSEGRAVISDQSHPAERFSRTTNPVVNFFRRIHR